MWDCHCTSWAIPGLLATIKLLDSYIYVLLILVKSYKLSIGQLVYSQIEDTFINSSVGKGVTSHTRVPRLFPVVLLSSGKASKASDIHSGNFLKWLIFTLCSFMQSLERQSDIFLLNNCYKYWWTNLLYINTLYPTTNAESVRFPDHEVYIIMEFPRCFGVKCLDDNQIENNQFVKSVQLILSQNFSNIWLKMTMSVYFVSRHAKDIVKTRKFFFHFLLNLKNDYLAKCPKIQMFR